MDAPSHPIRAAAAQASLGDGARTRPQVVIVGAGFGGLEAAKALRHAPVDVIVIDRVNHHCFQPLLYQVATAALSPADIAWPIRSILSRQANARVVMAEVTAVDTARKEVRTDRTPPFRYDFLVLATGATHSYFGHDDWAPYAPGLKRIEDATEIRRRLLRAFEAAELSQDEAERRRLMNFIVVGGGPTGVELAGACAEVARHVLSRDFRRIDPRTSRIILVEAGPRILPSFPEDLARYADRTLERMGVEVVTSTAVAQCDDMGVGTADGRRFDGATIVWAAGVMAAPAAQWLGVAHDQAGRVAVAPDLAAPGAEGVYAIGDVAQVARRDGGPVPGIAPAAKQMGRYVGRAIAARVAGRPAPAPFRYRHYGNLAAIGRRAAIVSIGAFHLRGFIGWLFWSIIHIYFLIGTRHRLMVAFEWFWDYLTFQRGARLITDYTPPLRRTDAP
ncbi:MAG TPA: NAD(P)/FAD-dependent oxidoreductase [Xanthobacteraceae bacterium]|jgi:NADH dehydrogenase|nr:NAD(P)/FAD-dependent oxidoreductase [Xanthobacteraceae bacterium]